MLPFKMKLLANYKTVFLILFYFFSSMSFSQESNLGNNEIGQPFIKYYSSRAYNANYQNWCVRQGKNGLMYFGNGEGVLEYDGVTWRLIKAPNNSNVRSLDIDENGRIYVAASSDFGYLSPDSAGQLKFVSLLKYLDNKFYNFGDTWDVVATSHGIYYKTQDKIFLWQGNKIKVFESVNAYRLYKINDDVYVRDEGVGLLKISGESLKLVPDGKRFASIGIYDMLPFKGKILITTNTDGLFLYDGNKFSRFYTEADSLLIQSRIYNTCRLNDGDFAFATQRGGVIIIDKEGHLLKLINSKSGLHSDIVYDVFPDRQGGLWLAMDEGISRIEISSAFSIIPKKNIGNTNLLSFYRFQNKLYAASQLGVFYFDESASMFRLVNGINSDGTNFISIGNSLFVSATNGIYVLTGSKAPKSLPFDFTSVTLYHSKIDTTIVYTFYRIGLAILKYDKGSLKLLKNISIVKDEIEYLVEDADGSLWIKTFYEGIIHLKCSNKNLFSISGNKEIVMNRYNSRNGLPGDWCDIISVSGKTLFATNAGLFRFDAGLKSFIPDSTFGESFAGSTYSISLYDETKNGDVWILAKGKNGNEIGKAVKQADGKYLWNPDPVLRRLDLTNVFTIYADYVPGSNKEFLWISTDEGLIRYNPDDVSGYQKNFSTFIRSIYINRDSLIYGGSRVKDSLKEKTIFSFGENDVQFQFSSASFDNSGATRFQYYLEGNDDEWSQWTAEPIKEYTNLSGGDYIFHVRAKNTYGAIGKEDTFAFTVLSPWYFSWWSYVVYAILFLGLLYLVRLMELKRLNKKHSVELELIEYKKLKELDQLKSQFFANISHEFRTPLTLILGQIGSVMSSKIDVKEKGKLQVADRNANRLLTLINQLLDLSKLEAGSMELKAEQHNIVSFLKSLFYSFESLAEQQKITLKFESEYQNIPVEFDPDKMEKVFYNLISNALKFTNTNDEIKVSLNVVNTFVEIRIKDTGIGIPAERLPHIFDRFYQVDSSTTREHEGTGIGLALTKELIELHKGTISVNSKEGEGTEFIIILPAPSPALPQRGRETTLPNNSTVLKVNKELQTSTYKTVLPETDFSSADAPSLWEGRQTPLSLSDSSRVGDRLLVLIVEDNPDVRAYIKEQLETDYKIVEASNGEEGVVKAKIEIPDLIITDVMMPKMDGYEFSKQIRSDEKTSHIPIIMLTAKAGLDDKIEGLETGIDAYLTKPFSSKELKAQVKNLISQREQLRKRFSKSTIIKPTEVSAASIDQTFLKKTFELIEVHFEDEQFGVEKLAEEMNMSVSQLSRKLHALIDQPPGQLIRSLRLQRAADLLLANAGTIAEICYRVGFSDQAYFSRAFKKQFGCSPSEYKNDYSKKSSSDVS